MKHFEIKITGPGTKEEIIASLQSIANDLQQDDVCNYEDKTLYMDIDECEPFNDAE